MRLFFILLAGLVMLPLLATSQAFAQEDSYRIRAGDVLRVEVLEDPSLNRNALVSPDGRISMQLVGTIKASGRSIEDLQAEIASRLASNFATTPTVFVSIEQVAERISSSGGGGAVKERTIDIFLIGEVAKPGKIAVEPGTTILQLFAEMGGFSKFAATKRIQLRRTDKASKSEKLYNFNYDAIERGTSNAGGTVVREGDIILVPQRRLFE